MRNGRRNSIINRMNEKFKSVFIAFVLVSAVFVGLIQTDFAGIVDNASADTGGPDAFGYTWTNSTGSPSVPYTWVDGITGGTALGLSDDDWGGPFNMGMSFAYYGAIYSDIYIMSNGWVSFVDSDSWYQSNLLPGDTFYQGVISPYSIDLNPGSSGEIYYKFIPGSTDQYVITWDAVPHFGSSDDQTFQIILNSTGEIWFNYQTMTNPDSFANVGIENEISTVGLDYDSTGGTPYSGLSILFEYTPPPYAVILDPENLEDYGFPGFDVDYILTVTNMGANDDTYDLASALNVWPVTFRDIGDTMDITTIFVTSGNNEDFIARVGIPGFAIPGNFDFANITATSQGDPSKYDYANIRTSIPFNVNWQDGFESGWGGWQTEVIMPSIPTTDWQIGDPFGWGPATAYNGTNCAGTNIVDDFYWNADILFITPYVELGAGQQILSYYHWYQVDTMGSAGGFVEISADGGPWNQVFPRNGYPYIGGWIGGYFVDAYSGNSPGWVFDEFDLSPYSGQVVQVRFHFVADGWSNQAGWYLDDVYMGSPPPYRVELTPKFLEDYGYSSSTVDYIFTAKNTGLNDDTYDLTASLNLWNTQFRDIVGGGQIFNIFVAAGTSEDFIVRVTVPGAASFGDFDFANITATSQGDPSRDDTSKIRTQVPYPINWIDGFETGGGPWVTQNILESSFMPTNWEFGDPTAGPGPAYNGTNSAGTNIITDYYPGADICLITPYVELGSGYQILSFYQAYEIDTWGDDGGFVEISAEGGPWTQIWPEGGYSYTGGFVGGYMTDAYSGITPGWIYEEFDLSAFSNQVVRVRFHFATSQWWGWQWGWYLDDVYMGSPPPYRNDLFPDWQSYVGYPLENVDYVLTVDNTGGNDDTYDLTSVNIWPVTFRDIGDTMDITNIFVTSGSSEDFIARITVPGFAVPGDLDVATINATSQGNPLVSDDAQIDTNVPVPPPVFDDMESGPGSAWNWSDGDGTEWQWGDPGAWPFGPVVSYSPFNCWGTNIGGNYTNDGEAILTAPYFDLRIVVSANITFWHWYDINPGWNDGGWMEITDDFGNSWNSLAPVGGYPEMTEMGFPCFAGTTFGWEQVEFDLTGYVGEVVRFRFNFWDDPFDGPVERAGWYIDDFNFSATYLAYGVELTPDNDFEIEPDGSNVLYQMTATNLGTTGPDTFDLSSLTILGWTVNYFDLAMTPITSVGPIPVGNSQDFYVQISIPGGTPPATLETSGITATSQNDPSMTPADDTSVLYTEVLAQFLLVDDDDGINSELEFGSALSANGWEYNIWDYDTYGPPELADLQQHQAVIWFTGNTYDDTMVPSLTLEDRTNLGNFLDGGGRLYLSASLAGPDATDFFGGLETWNAWYMNYLHSSFINMGGFGAPHLANGTTGDPISHNLDLTAYQGDFNPSLWGAWMENDPINFGVQFFTEPSISAGIAMRADTGVYRMVYTAFDFATVNGAVDRSVLMYRILKWLLDLPIVLDTVAQDKDTSVSINQNVQVIYSESMNSLITPTLSQVGGPDPGGWTFSGWSTTYVTDDTATWTHNNWAYGQDVNMSVSGAQDLDANVPDTFNWDFSTETAPAPWATATGPTTSLTNNPSPSITYNYGDSPTNVEIYWSDNGGVSWNLWGTDASVDGTWPAGIPLPSSGTYVWNARAMGTPNEAVPSGPGDIEASSYVLDIDVPSIFSTIPIDMATGISTAAGVYVIEFDEPMANLGTPLSDLPGVVWNWAPSALWINGSYSPLNPSTTYYVDLVGQGFTDLASNGLSGDMYKDFTTVVADPWATATGPTSLLTNNPSPTITYNYGNAPTSVEIYWSDNGGASWNLWGTDGSVDSSWPAGNPLGSSGTYVWSTRAIGTPSEAIPSGPGDVEASSYVLDIDAPSIFATIPIDMATGISTIAGIYVIEFNEPMANVGTPLTDLPGVVWNWAPSGLWINGSYSPLNPSTTYYVDLTGQGFTDLASNALSGDMYKDFTTQVPDPWATATGPILGITNNPSPSMTYNFGNAPTSVEIYWTDNGGTSWNLWGTDGSVDSSWPAGSPLPASGTYEWNVRAIGSVNESVPTGAGDIESGPYVLDLDAPSVFSTTPIDTTTGISTAAGLYIIEFDEPMNNSFTPLSDLPGIGWVWAPSGLWLNGSYNALNPSTTYYVDFTGQGFCDLAGNALSGDLYKNFTTLVSADPWATATGPTSSITNNPSPTITYNYGNAPTSVEIYWSDNGGVGWNLWGTDGSVDSSWPAAGPLPASGTYVWSARAIGAPSEAVPSGPGDIEASSYALDIDAPSVFSTTPNDMASGISTAAGIYIIEFDEPMNNGFTPLSDLPGISWVWAPSGLWLNGSYNALNPSTTYYVDFTGQGFIDLATNALSGDLYKDFTTLITANPWATATGPISILTNNPNPTITYNFGNAPTSVEIYWSDDGGSSWNLWGTDFTVDGSWPAGSPLPVSGTYDWSARAIGAPSEAVPSGVGDFEAGSYVVDIDAPEVSTTTPLDAAIDVFLNQLIIIIFNETMNPGTLTYTIEPNPGGLSESWIGGDILQISHTDFAPGTRVWINITGASDTAGNNLNPLPYSFYFDTEIPDITPPTVSLWTPTGVSVLITSNIVLTFSESMDTASVEAAFSFTDGVTTWTVADGTANWNPSNDIMTFNPTANFDNSKIITVTILATAEDENANTLDGNNNGTAEGSPTDDHVWQFTTESAPIPDTTAPISSITVLPDYITDLTFNIIYTASDTESGVKEVELWYRKDGGGWGLYNTYIGGSRTVSFTADSDGEYDFYTRARDNDNNYESAPSNPDTSTILDTEIPEIVSVELSDPSPTHAGAVTFTITFSEDLNLAVELLVTFGSLSPYAAHSVIKSSFTSDTWIGTFTIDPLTGDGQHTLKISLAEDLAGNQIAEHTMQFAIDTNAPSVSSGGPTGDDVPITTAITITFDESMNKTTVLDAFSFTDGTTTWTAADGTVSWSANTMTFTPDEDLSYDTDYAVTMAVGARDPADNALAGVYNWTFTTHSEPDTTAPSISSVSHTGEDAEVTNTMTITFTEPMNHSKVEASISVPGMEIQGFSWTGNRLTITFTSDLEAGEDYTVTIGTDAEDEAGNALEEPYSWSFTPKEKVEEPAASNFLLILLLIIVIVVVLILVMLMKKKKPEQHASHEHEEPYPQEDNIYGKEHPEGEGIQDAYEEPPENAPSEMPEENIPEENPQD